MAKDVNIHVKTQGTPQVKQDLQDVTQSVNKVGDNVEKMGSRSSRAMEWLASGIKSLAGPIGFAALIGVVSKVTGTVSKFFDDLKNRCDEAVNKLQNLRKGFEGVFEAMDAFDEKTRKEITKGTIDLLGKNAIPQEIGLPVIEAYTRQFGGLVQTGQLSPEQYRQGLEGMLGYAARHGQASTPELITLMSGWGMTTAEQQGVFRRQIGAVSKVTGLTDEEIIDSLGRAAPTAKIMGWQPAEILNYIGTIAAGEIGRKKQTLPATTIEAIINPQLTNLKDYKITPQQAENPAQLLALLAVKQRTMDEKSFGRMLMDIYGREAAAGVTKLLKSPGGELTEAIKWAATPQAVSAEMAEEATSRETKERLAAKTQMARAKIYEKGGNDYFYRRQIRDIGAEKQEELRIQHPYLQWLFENINMAYAFGIIPGEMVRRFKSEGTKKEDAAFVQWFSGLTDEEKQEILSKKEAPIGDMLPDALRLKRYYRNMPPEQQYQDLTRQGDTHVHYHNDVQYFPSVGDREVGPRTGRDIK